MRMLLTSTKCLMPAFSVWRRILTAPSIEAFHMMLISAEQGRGLVRRVSHGESVLGCVPSNQWSCGVNNAADA